MNTQITSPDRPQENSYHIARVPLSSIQEAEKSGWHKFIQQFIDGLNIVASARTNREAYSYTYTEVNGYGEIRIHNQQHFPNNAAIEDLAPAQDFMNTLRGEIDRNTEAMSAIQTRQRTARRVYSSLPLGIYASIGGAGVPAVSMSPSHGSPFARQSDTIAEAQAALQRAPASDDIWSEKLLLAFHDPQSCLHNFALMAQAFRQQAEARNSWAETQILQISRLGPRDLTLKLQLHNGQHYYCFITRPPSSTNQGIQFQFSSFNAQWVNNPPFVSIYLLSNGEIAMSIERTIGKIIYPRADKGVRGHHPEEEEFEE